MHSLVTSRALATDSTASNYVHLGRALAEECTYVLYRHHSLRMRGSVGAGNKIKGDSPRARIAASDGLYPKAPRNVEWVCNSFRSKVERCRTSYVRDSTKLPFLKSNTGLGGVRRSKSSTSCSY